ncbi:hypothetical protein [Streptomyces sp. NPDC002054]|uniref:hypothetical protein n=1 Tax=Streptomyces sp. NPDC002054 TaxID=3154663 RepID=UPI0033178657
MGTCVASSTVTSRAMVEPLYALSSPAAPTGSGTTPTPSSSARWPNSTRCTPKVPVAVSGEEGAHAMTSIAQEGDMLRVYNPWGSTTWVSENDFINGYTGKASNSDLPNAYKVCLPR